MNSNYSFASVSSLDKILPADETNLMREFTETELDYLIGSVEGVTLRLSPCLSMESLSEVDFDYQENMY